MIGPAIVIAIAIIIVLWAMGYGDDRKRLRLCSWVIRGNYVIKEECYQGAMLLRKNAIKEECYQGAMLLREYVIKEECYQGAMLLREYVIKEECY